jgi:hypothetical protein
VAWGGDQPPGRARSLIVADREFHEREAVGIAALTKKLRFERRPVLDAEFVDALVDIFANPSPVLSFHGRARYRAKLGTAASWTR